jgi:hypothetical protein
MMIGGHPKIVGIPSELVFGTIEALRFDRSLVGIGGERWRRGHDGREYGDPFVPRRR